LSLSKPERRDVGGDDLKYASIHPSGVAAAVPGRFGQGEVVSDAIAVATPILVLDDVAGFGELRDGPERAALGDAERGGDVAQAHAEVVRDADEGPGVIGEEAPLRTAQLQIRLS
jgi:hypothetical protein